MPNIVYARAWRVAVMVAGRESPSDAEWDRYIDFLEGMQTPGPFARTLAVTAGGAPSSAQRIRLQGRIGEARKGSKLALVTDSTFARGILNSWSLLRPGYRAFAPDKLAEALRFLDVSLAQALDLEALVLQLQAELSLPADEATLP